MFRAIGEDKIQRGKGECMIQKEEENFTNKTKKWKKTRKTKNKVEIFSFQFFLHSFNSLL